MADGLCTADAVSNVNVENATDRHDDDNGAASEAERGCENAVIRRTASDSDQLLFDEKFCSSNDNSNSSAAVVVNNNSKGPLADGGMKDAEIGAETTKRDEGFCSAGIVLTEEDCRKKRCVDRYDSSESSDRLVN